MLHYAGDGKFSYEEDAYNPASFVPMVTTWLGVVAQHEGER